MVYVNLSWQLQEIGIILKSPPPLNKETVFDENYTLYIEIRSINSLDTLT